MGSYERRIIELMLRRSEALERSDEQTAAEDLVAASRVADLMRKQPAPERCKYCGGRVGEDCNGRPP